MAYTFPMALADFFDTLPLTQITIDLAENVIQSGATGAGEILTASIGQRLWYGDVIFQPMYFEDADEMAAKVSILREPGRSFYVYNGARNGPRNDPKGVILGAATPQISSVASNNRDLLLKSLPAGYVLAAGDEIAWDYGSSPTRRALHKIVKGGTANGAGQLTVELTPGIRSGAVADTVVTLVRPACKAIMVPGSFNPGTYGDNAVTGMKFSWRQTLR